MSKFKKNINGNIVYSTNKDFSVENEDDQEVGQGHSQKQQLKVWLEKNARGGKTVSIVRGYVGSEDELEKLAKLLKTKCGVGGSVKNGEILIQGDHREKILKILAEMGHQVKKAGG